MRKIKVLVTGGSGFIGTNLTEALLSKGAEVKSLDLGALRNPAHKPFLERVDLVNREALESAVVQFQPEVIFHLGARTDLLGKSISDYEANTEGVRNVVAAARAAGSVKQIFFASSRLVCRIGYQPTSDTDYCPPNAYGESKVETERIVRAADLEIPWCLFRPTSIWGPWFDIPYKDFFTNVARGRYVHPRGTKIHKSFGYVGNSVYQLLSLMDGDPARFDGKTFYLCDYPPLEVGEWADEIAEEMKVRTPLRVPEMVLQAGALAGDALKALGMKHPPLTSFRLANLKTEMLHETKFLEEAVGPLPFSRREGVKLTVAWMKQSGQPAK
jgi:nucleoside-diphosphate-sugar epimerase